MESVVDLGADEFSEESDGTSAGSADPLLGRVVRTYRVERVLGRGAMGAVYLAVHPTIGSKVAVKVLHPRYARDRSIVDRFFNEARAVNLIEHDHVVRALDFGTLEEGAPFMIMEYLEGRPLTALTGRPLPIAEAGPILLQIADGLAAAHEKGVVHRDLKPDNVYLVRRGRRENEVKLLDFGIAKLGATHVSTHTQVGIVMGTAHYMSPEQAGGANAQVGPHSDIYALGVMMFELATGQRPFAGSSYAETLVAHMMQEPPAPRSLVPDVPAAWEALILRCLQKAPADRPGSMTEVYDTLQEILTDVPAPARPRSNPGAFIPPLPGQTNPSTNPPLVLGTSPATLHASSATMDSPPTSLLTPRPSKTRPVVFAGIAGLLVVGGVVLFALRPAPAVAPAPAAPPEVAAPVAAAPVTIPVTFEVVPVGARVVVRQGAMTTDVVAPATVELREEEPAHVEVSSPGHRVQEDLVSASSPVTKRYVLVPEEVAPPPVAAPRPKTPAPAPAKAAKPAPKQVGDAMVDVEL